MATPTGVVETLRVSSSGMLPTLSVGQIIHISLDRHYVPKIGDIVLFHPPRGADSLLPRCGNPNEGQGGDSQACDAPTPQESSQVFVKRIVAGPGDTVFILEGHVFRDAAQEGDSSYTEPCGGDISCTFRTPIAIPQGDYFVLGDNRGASDDSRFWGPVPRAWIIGKLEP